MSAPRLPRTADEAIDAYLRERSVNPELPPITNRYDTLRWFFDAGVASGMRRISDAKSDAAARGEK